MMPRTVVLTCIFWTLGFVSSAFSTPDNRDVRIRHAMVLSETAARNITAAREACQLWEDILVDPETEERRSGGPEELRPLPRRVDSLCRLFYASCLVRVGRDRDAVAIYQRILDYSSASDLDSEARERAIVGQGSSLQRLLRYREALNVFDQGTSAEALWGSVTCALRCGDLDHAQNVLSKRTMREESSRALQPLRAVLQYMHSGSVEPPSSDASSPRLHVLCQWLQCREGDRDIAWIQDIPPVQLAQTNNSPFDDPRLIHLDDKVLLHKLLTEESKEQDYNMTFWPKGYVLDKSASEQESFIKRDGGSLTNSWILKARSGYGSHGNTILSTQQALLLKPTQEPALLQQLIHPTLLLEQQKFSLRIYVTYFMPMTEKEEPEVYVSRNGLVKLASEAYDSNQVANESTSAEDMFMTNSGRRTEARQETLDFLRANMERVGKGARYGEVWQSITEAVSSVMSSYFKFTTPSHTSTSSHFASLHKLGLPKILGFDFLVDANYKVWLLEVNRFPGLEARTEKDAEVKNTVLRQSWMVAYSRVDTESNFNVNSFEKVVIE